MSRAPITAVVCGGLNLLRCFAGRPLATALIAWEADELALHSRYGRHQQMIHDPATAPDRALVDLVAIGQGLPGRPALFYDNEPMLLLIARNREILGQYYRFLVPDRQLVEDLTNKVRFAALAERLNLPAPRTLLSHQVSSADEAAERLILPCIFKPISHVGWYNTDIVREAGDKPFKALLASSPEQFRWLWQRMGQYARDFVVQEYVPGADDCIYSFHAYYDHGSKALGQFVGRKIRTYPKVSGISTYLELVEDAEVARLGREILAKLRFVGPVKLDFKRDPVRNRLYLLEINARFNLWHYLGAACGINLPYIAYLDLHGHACQPATEYRTGVRWLSLDNDVRAFMKDYHPDGDLSWLSWLWSLRGEKVYNVFSWRDPRPWAVMVRRYLREYRKYSRKLLQYADVRKVSAAKTAAAHSSSER